MKPYKNCPYSEGGFVTIGTERKGGKINLVQPRGSLDGDLDSRDGALLHLHPTALLLRLAHLPSGEDRGVETLPRRH